MYDESKILIKRLVGELEVEVIPELNKHLTQEERMKKYDDYEDGETIPFVKYADQAVDILKFLYVVLRTNTRG